MSQITIFFLPLFDQCKEIGNYFKSYKAYCSQPFYNDYFNYYCKKTCDLCVERKFTLTHILPRKLKWTHAYAPVLCTVRMPTVS